MPESRPPAPPEPERVPLDPAWREQHGTLYERVRAALAALPAYFDTGTVIAGIIATDIHTLNAALGATIEEQVVRVLNSMRSVWDPEQRYSSHHFVRQPQTYPDVLLREAGSRGRQGILLGVELKSWYLLAKEEEPSFRFRVTEEACAPQDLVVVVPWALDNVVSGKPVVYTPWIEQARYCARWRNYYWSVLRTARQGVARGIDIPRGVEPYPTRSESIDDVPSSDVGGNFGRLARTGLMDGYVSATLETSLCGIAVKHWLAFFRAFRERAHVKQVSTALERLARATEQSFIESPKGRAVRQIVEALCALLDDVESHDPGAAGRTLD